jgi:mannose-6-phosphate isomerase
VYKSQVLGYPLKTGDKFPLLVKFIDARENLSVQVHPDDAYARVNEKGELGKNEAWLVLEVEKGAKLVAGLKKGITKEDFVEAIEQDTVESVLNEVEVKKGDVINIPAGFVHAIGAGVLLAEVQQNSDTTYRVYDYNRKGLDGKLRALHVAQSLEVIDFEGKHSKNLVPGLKWSQEMFTVTYYISNQYFALERIDISATYNAVKEKNFEIYLCIEGQGKVVCKGEEYGVKAGDSLLIPAVISNYQFVGNMSVVKSYVPVSPRNVIETLIKKGYKQADIQKNMRVSL